MLPSNSASTILIAPDTPGWLASRSGWGWDDATAYDAPPQQIGVMIYPAPTSAETGALRILPGSHRHAHPLHRSVDTHHAGLSRFGDPKHPPYQPAPGELRVPSRPSDVIVVDARTLHGVYPNAWTEERMLLTLRYHPFWSDLPASIRSRACQALDGTVSDLSADTRPTPREWPLAVLDRIRALVPEPTRADPIAFNRRPDVTRTLEPFDT